MKRFVMLTLIVTCFICVISARAMSNPNPMNEQITIVISPDAHSRIRYGAGQLQKALQQTGIKAEIVTKARKQEKANTILIGTRENGDLFKNTLSEIDRKKEGFALICKPDSKVTIAGVDDSGALYGCLELAERIEMAEKLPKDLVFRDSPTMLLRGPCIGMQRPELLYDNVMYDYRYLPETFPWFYDKELWTDYLNLLVKHRNNTLYLWNGHPFTSILRLPKYPEAQEVPTEQLEKNIELFKWLCAEADKRGIWVVQFFYNIHISHTLARHHGVSYTHSVPTDLTRDYTSYCITEFIKNYPNVGLMMCLGEALSNKYDAEWLADVIIPAVKAGLKPNQDNPPIIVRNHSTNIEEVLNAARPLYDNIYTMAKYTGETLASNKVAGGGKLNAQLNQWELQKRLAKDYMLISNVHCVCNLEPFRWGSPSFVQSAMQSCEQIGIKGLHLYPMRYWDWPVTADIAAPPLLQPDRDWIWYATWARYAWDPYRDPKQERIYWIQQVADRYGNEKAGEHILDAYELSGDVMPMVNRRISAKSWNTQAHTMGQTIDQLFYSSPWFGNPEESIAVYAKREVSGEEHKGISPIVATETMVKNSEAALKAAIAAGPYVEKNKQEYERLVNDMRALSLLSNCYKHKTMAAISGLMFLDTADVADLDRCVAELEKSMEFYRKLAAVTKDAYRDCAGHHSQFRLIPFPINEGLVWSDVIGKFEDELALVKRNAKIMRENIELLKNGVKPYPVVKVSCSDENNIFRVEKGALVHTKPATKEQRDNEYRKGTAVSAFASTPLERVSDDFVGLNSIRVPKNGPYEVEFRVDEPVRVFVGFALQGIGRWNYHYPDWEVPEGWKLYVPKAVDITYNCCDVYYRDFPAGTSTLEFEHGAEIIVLGFTKQDVPLHPMAKRYYDWQMFTCPIP